MTKEQYENSKEKYIYKITKNGLIITTAINNKAYMFRNTEDKIFEKYLTVTDASEEFLKLVIAEAQGRVFSFDDDKEVEEVVQDDDSSKEVEVVDITEELKEVKDKLEFQGIELIHNFKDYYDMMYTADDYDGFKTT